MYITWRVINCKIMNALTVSVQYDYWIILEQSPAISLLGGILQLLNNIGFLLSFMKNC